MATVAALILGVVQVAAWSPAPPRKDTGIEVHITSIKRQKIGGEGHRIFTVTIHNKGKKAFWLGCQKEKEKSKIVQKGNPLGIAYHASIVGLDVPEQEKPWQMLYREDGRWVEDDIPHWGVQADTWRRFEVDEKRTIEVPLPDRHFPHGGYVCFVVSFSDTGELQGHFPLHSNTANINAQQDVVGKRRGG